MRWPDLFTQAHTAIVFIPSVMQKYFSQTNAQIATTALSTAAGANKAYYYPFEIDRLARFTTAFIFNASTVAGNWDIGIYDETGVRRWSAGSTAMSGTNTPQSFTISGGITLDRGAYYLGYVNSSTGAAWCYTTASPAWDWPAAGHMVQTSASPLPATATFATTVDAIIPYIGITGRLL